MKANEKANIENKEGWSIDITNKRATHYYKNGASLCGKETQKFYMDNFDKSIEYSQVLGYVCSLCEKKIKRMQLILTNQPN